MYACVVHKKFNVAIVLYNGELLADFLELFPDTFMVIALGSSEDCQMCADAYNEY